MQKEMGKRIAKLRGAQKQEELAAKLHIRREKFSMWEQGRRMLKAPDIVDLANHFKVSTDYLLYGVEPDNLNTHQDMGLSQAAIESLRQFKESDIILGTNEPAGKCEALSKALSNEHLLNSLATLINTPKGEPGYYEGSTLSDDGKFHLARLSPDSFVAVLYQRLQLIIQAIRTSDESAFVPYAPMMREAAAFASDPANYSELHRKRQAKERMLKELNSLDQEIVELEEKGDANG